MKRLHCFIAFLLSAAFLCLSTGMSRIHLCSSHCCKDKVCQMQSHSPHSLAACCEKKQAGNSPARQQVSSACNCISVLYKTDACLNQTDVILPEIICTDISLQAFTWYSIPEQNIKICSTSSHAPPLSGRSILALHSILII